MKVGILGSGDVGQALGRGFAARGHEVMIGSRNPKGEGLAKWLRAVKGKATTGSFEEAAKHGEVVVLATRGAAVVKEFGWRGTVDLGGIEGARWLEASVSLWVLVGMHIGRWDHAFKVVHG